MVKCLTDSYAHAGAGDEDLAVVVAGGAADCRVCVSPRRDVGEHELAHARCLCCTACVFAGDVHAAGLAFCIFAPGANV